MKQNDVVTVLTLSGEYIGKLIERVGGTIALENPRMLVQDQQGNMGFSHGICVTGEPNPKEVTFASYVLVTPTNEDIVKAWRKATTGIITV